MKNIGIFICESAWAGSISLTLEILKTAIKFQEKFGKKPSYSLTLFGLEDSKINTFSGITLKPDQTIANNQYYDAILLPAVWDINEQYLQQHKALYPWLVDQYQQGSMVFGLLTGSYFMAESGLLNNHHATTHWRYADDFRQRYPQVKLSAEKMYTLSNRLYCGGGVNAVMDLSMFLINNFCGSQIAQQCERHCLMGTRRDYHMLNTDNFKRQHHNDLRIYAIQKWIDNHYAEPFTIDEVTARFGFSARNLNRRFTKAVGMPFQKYLQQHRINAAKQLLRQTELSIQQICFNCGYSTLTAFGRRFKSLVGCSASEYRKAHVDSNISSNR